MSAANQNPIPLRNQPAPDELAATRAEIKQLQGREAELRVKIITDAAARTGIEYEAQVTTSKATRHRSTDHTFRRQCHRTVLSRNRIYNRQVKAPCHSEASMSAHRERLPNRRASENFTFELDGLRFTATVSRSANGDILELFLNNHKAGNQVDTNARDAAILLSFALQHGADINAIRAALCRDSHGRPLGPIARALDILEREP